MKNNDKTTTTKTTKKTTSKRQQTTQNDKNKNSKKRQKTTKQLGPQNPIKSMVSWFLVSVQNDPGDFSCVGSAACPVGLKAFRSPEGAEELLLL